MEPDITDFEHSVGVIDNMIHDSACLLTIERWEELLQALEIVVPSSSLVVDKTVEDSDEDIEWAEAN
tara:strand:+ start:16596 stop:16796 length:201 start_codon:yes stop_codon:yes gene_type:complete